MRTERGYVGVLVTTPNLKVARTLAGAILEDHLAACINIIPGVESHYWWQGKREKSKEHLLVIKTRNRQLPALEQCILQRHPYDVPEFLVFPLSGGSARYLDWLSASIAGRV